MIERFTKGQRVRSEVPRTAPATEIVYRVSGCTLHNGQHAVVETYDERAGYHNFYTDCPENIIYHKLSVLLPLA